MLFVFNRCLLQLLKSSAELVWAGGALRTAPDTVKTLDHIVDVLSSNQRTDTLEIAVTSSKEENLLDHIVLIGSHIDQFRASASRFILYMFRLHISHYLFGCKDSKKTTDFAD
jgi:hypothetical protein